VFEANTALWSAVPSFLTLQIAGRDNPSGNDVGNFLGPVCILANEPTQLEHVRGGHRARRSGRVLNRSPVQVVLLEKRTVSV
jgi:hypothetical protein